MVEIFLPMHASVYFFFCRVMDVHKLLQKFDPLFWGNLHEKFALTTRILG
jgi:hypothetical protein